MSFGNQRANVIASDVGRLFSSFRSSNVFKLCVKLPFTETRKPGARKPNAVDVCADFATHLHVEDLTLVDLMHSSDKGSISSYYHLYKYNQLVIDNEVFNISSLVKLNLSWCQIKLPPLVSLPLLRALVLDDVKITTGDAEELVSNCPELESLRMKGFGKYGVNVYIRHPNLRSL